MKPKPTLQKKRKAPKASGFRMLHAKTGNRKRRKQRAATATAEDLEGEVPGVGVARALVVILLLHAVAVGGIWFHSKWSEENDLQATPATPVAPEPAVKPSLVPGGKHYFVERGDNYLNIARKHGVDVEALKAANNSAEISPGLKINIPPRRIESTSPSQAIAGTQTSEMPPVRPNERPLIQPNGSETRESNLPGAMVAVEGENKPILIKPRIRHGRTPSKAIPVEETLSGKTYVVSKGDSIWKIANQFGVSQESLMRVNGISDATKLRLGATLKIPAQ